MTQALPLIARAKAGQKAALTAATRLVMAADDHRENVETIRHRIELRDGGQPQRLDSAAILEATAAVAALARKHR